MAPDYRKFSGTAFNSAARWATPRNVGGYFGYRAMQATVEALWYRQRKNGELTAIIADHFVKSGCVAIDVGASWGLFSYHLGRRAGDLGSVFCYEPHPANAAVLEKLAKARPSVRFASAAVSDVAGQADMQVPVHGKRRVTAQSSIAHGFEAVLDVEVEKLTVPTVRLDDEIPADVHVDFIKIDVEGHELPVLRGAAATLRRCLPPMLIEIEQRHLEVPIEAVFRELAEFGYKIFFIEAGTLRSIDQFDLQTHQISAVQPNRFTPFGMPDGYVCNFCAVPDAAMLAGLPGFTLRVPRPRSGPHPIPPQRLQAPR